MDDAVAREIIASLTSQVHGLMDEREAYARRISAAAEIVNRETWAEDNPDDLQAALVHALAGRSDRIGPIRRA